MKNAALTRRIIRFADENQALSEPFQTGIDGVTIVRSREQTRLQAVRYTPLLCLVLQGRKESYLGGKRVAFAAGETLIVSIDLSSVSRITEASEAAPYVALAVEIDLGIIRQLTEELGETSITSAQSAAMAVGAVDEDLAEAMERLFRLVEKPQDRPALLPLVMREIHYRLLLARHGGMLRRLAHSDSHVSRIERVLHHIRLKYDEPLRIPALANIAGMSVSSFHDHFKAVTATTPLKYQKDLRLMEARDRLIGGEDSVAAVAIDVGYESPAQFSREYSRKFGMPPSGARKLAMAV